MYAMLLNLWVTNRLTDAQLDNAVTKKWITQAQADQIRADKAAQDEAQAIIDGLVVDALN